MKGKGTYIGFVTLGIAGLVCLWLDGKYEWFKPEHTLGIIQVLGSFTAVRLRMAVGGPGWKTFAGSAAMGVVGLLTVSGVIPDGASATLLTLIGSWTGVSIRHAIAKKG